MKLDPQDLCAPTHPALDVASTRTSDRTLHADLDGPAVLTHGEGRVLFGPGIDDFNAFDDPC